MLSDKEINKEIHYAERKIKEIEMLPAAEQLQATCEFLELDLTRETDRMYLQSLNYFMEASRTKFAIFDKDIKGKKQ